MLIGLTPLPDDLPLDPQDNRAAIEHVTELVVIVALMGVGLALDRPLQLRQRESWRAVGAHLAAARRSAMPRHHRRRSRCSAGRPASRRRRRCCSAPSSRPTDPVLASDVQVAGPQTGDHEVDEADELRFTPHLRGRPQRRAGLPLRVRRDPARHRGRRVGTGRWSGSASTSSARSSSASSAGIVVGRVLAYVAFRSSSRSLRVAERGESLLALAALVASYGVGEVAGGYGFLVGVRVRDDLPLRRALPRLPRGHARRGRAARAAADPLRPAGARASRSPAACWTRWTGAASAIGLALILVVRPLAGLLALAPWCAAVAASTGGLTRAAAVGGRVLRRARASGRSTTSRTPPARRRELGQDWLWSTVAFTIVASVLVHGVLSTPVMARLEPDRTLTPYADTRRGDPIRPAGRG